jgi:predicted RNase H-like nuclease (RuvC/YqgF family)
MKKIYRIETMTSESYTDACCGGYNNHIDILLIGAESVEEAIIEAKKTAYWVNEETVELLDEYNRKKAEWREKCEAERKALELKKEEAKKRKIEKDLANGITPEMRKAMTTKKRYETEVRKAEKEIEELKKRIAEYTAKIEKLGI